MRKSLLKIVVLSAVFVIGASLAAIKQNNEPIRVEATQYLDDYSPYTYSGSYYDSIDFDKTGGLNGDLRKSLTSYIIPKAFYTYGSQGDTHLATQLQYADEDPTNNKNMVYLYTRDSVAKNAASSWNREHVWPQSLSNGNWGTDEAGTDILHIRPTYNTTNGTRGNDLYGDNGKSGPVYYNDMLYGYTGGSYFEPIDEVKGDVARIIMYVWTAYTGYSGYKSLSVLNVFESYDTLLKWHTLDKPDALEGNRNDYSEKTSIQKNRNPFVDHPELAWKIFGDSASATVKNECMSAYPSDGSGQNQKQLSSIALGGEATYKDYYVGQSFNPLGLTVTANYDDGTSKEISTSSCSWLPDPLTEGLTSVTCKYGNCTAVYSGITVSKRTSVGGEYSVEFLNTADSGSEISSTTISNYWKNNDLVESVTDLVKVFPGDSGLKLGSGSANGQITFNINSAAQNNIAKVTIGTTSYKGNGTYTVKLGNDTIGSGLTAGVLFTKDLQKVSATKLTITSGGRIYLNSITFEIESSQSSSSEPPISSSIPPSSSESSLPPSSSEQSSSSIISSESSSISSSSIESSSSISSESSSSKNSSGVYSSSDDVSSTSSVISSSESVSESSSIESSFITPSSEEVSSSEQQVSSSEPTKKSGGCHGSIIGTISLTGLTALIGLIFVLSKKK